MVFVLVWFFVLLFVFVVWVLFVLGTNICLSMVYSYEMYINV